ncbi:MAG: polysaccharide biosynthesis tyrosine autokinase [Salibacteraceae bacterium]
MSLEEQIEQSSRQETAQFKESIGRYLKKWPWIIAFLVLALTLTHFRMKFVANGYKVESSVQIKKSSQVDNPTDLLFGARYSRRMMGTGDETLILKSFPLVKATVKSLKFDVTYTLVNGFLKKEVYENKPFIFKYNREPSEAKLPVSVPFNVTILNENKFSIKTEVPFQNKLLDQVGTFGESIDLGTFSFKVLKTGDFEKYADFENSYSIRINTIEKVAYAYRNKLKFNEPEPFSQILTLSINTKTPQKAVDFINSLIEKYVEQNLIDKNEAAKNTVEFIDSQLAIISDSLNSKERNLESFKISEQSSSISVEGKLLVEKYNEIESEKAQYEVRQQYYDYLKNNIDRNGESNASNLIAPTAFGIEDLIINDLVKSLLDLNLTEKQLIQDGNDKSPMLEQIKNRKKEVSTALEESIDNLSKANRIILSNLNDRIDDIGVSAQRLPSSERQLVNLNRLLKLNENIYLFLMEKRSNAAIAMSSNTSDCKIIEPAMLNPLYPISPNRKMVYLIATIIGIVLPLLIIIILDFLNDIIRGKEDIEMATQTPIMGLVPIGKKENVRFVAIEKPKSVLAESFRIIRTNLSFFQKDKSPFVIMVTSTIAKEGKTFCAINLASVLAASNKKTVLLGFDLRKPQIHNYIGVENKSGISNYLTNQAELDEIIVSTDQENFSIINSGNIPPNPSELLISSRTKQLFNELKERFDYIIIDTPPIGIVADALILKEESDLNLYVVRQGYSKRDFVNRINELYVTHNLPNLSILLNDAKKATSYGSGYYEEENNDSLMQRIMRFKK